MSIPQCARNLRCGYGGAGCRPARSIAQGKVRGMSTVTLGMMDNPCVCPRRGCHLPRSTERDRRGKGTLQLRQKINNPIIIFAKNNQKKKIYYICIVNSCGTINRRLILYDILSLTLLFSQCKVWKTKQLCENKKAESSRCRRGFFIFVQKFFPYHKEFFVFLHHHYAPGNACPIALSNLR